MYVQFNDDDDEKVVDFETCVSVLKVRSHFVFLAFDHDVFFVDVW